MTDTLRSAFYKLPFFNTTLINYLVSREAYLRRTEPIEQNICKMVSTTMLCKPFAQRKKALAMLVAIHPIF